MNMSFSSSSSWSWSWSSPLSLFLCRLHLTMTLDVLNKFNSIKSFYSIFHFESELEKIFLLLTLCPTVFLNSICVFVYAYCPFFSIVIILKKREENPGCWHMSTRRQIFAVYQINIQCDNYARMMAMKWMKANLKDLNQFLFIWFPL